MKEVKEQRKQLSLENDAMLRYNHSESWQWMILSSDGRSEEVKITMFRTCTCDYLN